MASYGQGGRKPGSQNYVGAKVRQTILDVFMGLGGLDAMIAWALKNKTEFYKLYGRLIPTEITGSIDIHDASELTEDELIAIIARARGGGDRDTGKAPGEEVFPPVH